MNTQMATPISSLPLKTSPQTNESDLEDPLIQNVLKEFEDEMAVQQAQQQAPQMYQPQSSQQPQQVTQPQQQMYQIPSQVSQMYQPYHLQNKKLFNMDIAKKTLVITIIVVLLQHNNILNMLLSKLPDSVNSYISGRELLLNFAIVFFVS